MMKFIQICLFVSFIFAILLIIAPADKKTTVDSISKSKLLNDLNSTKPTLMINGDIYNARAYNYAMTPDIINKISKIEPDSLILYMPQPPKEDESFELTATLNNSTWKLSVSREDMFDSDGTYTSGVVISLKELTVPKLRIGEIIQNVHTGDRRKIVKIKFINGKNVYELNDGTCFNDDYAKLWR